MARKQSLDGSDLAASAVPGVQRLTLEEARKALPEVARRFSQLTEPSDSLVEQAVAVGPHRKTGLVMIPEVDVIAAMRELEELEDDLEVFGMMLLARERLAEPTPAEDLIPVEDLARRFGAEELLDA